MPRLPSPAALLSSGQRKTAAHKSIHLPSQLGSDVGNAFTTDTQADEKAHMEVMVNGVADRVLREAPPGQENGHHFQQEQTHGELSSWMLHLEGNAMHTSFFPGSLSRHVPEGSGRGGVNILEDLALHSEGSRS